MTTQQAYNDFLNKLLTIYEKREAANIADWIFENVTGFKRLERSMQKNILLQKDDEQKLKKYLQELLKHKPVQYVLNEAWFYKSKFFVNEHVLIPRPETEELVEWIVEDFRCSMFDEYKEIKILDIGTGSGCIAVSLKKELQNINITAIDISEEALKIAKKNAKALHARINFFQTDFLNEAKWNSFGKYDIIVSNPPYISEEEKNSLAKNVTAFEPAVALFVPNNNVLIFYEKIAKFMQTHLQTNGNVYAEIHENYSHEVQQIFSKHNFKTEIKKDMYGKERMIKTISNEG